MGDTPLETGYIQLETRGRQKVEGDLDAISKRFGSAAEAAEKMHKRMEAVFGGYLGVEGIKKLYETFEEREKSVNRLNAAIHASGDAAGYTAGQVRAMADELAEATMFTKEQAYAAAAVMAPFTNIKGDTFRETLKLSADLATVMGTDLPEAARMLGKALNDPEHAAKLLRGVGITLMEEEKEEIEVLQRSGDAHAAQTVILEKLMDRYKGAAEEMAHGIPMVMKNIKESTADATVEIVKFWAKAAGPGHEDGKFDLAALGKLLTLDAADVDIRANTPDENPASAKYAAKARAQTEATYKELGDIKAEKARYLSMANESQAAIAANEEQVKAEEDIERDHNQRLRDMALERAKLEGNDIEVVEAEREKAFAAWEAHIEKIENLTGQQMKEEYDALNKNWNLRAQIAEDKMFLREADESLKAIHEDERAAKEEADRHKAGVLHFDLMNHDSEVHSQRMGLAGLAEQIQAAALRSGQKETAEEHLKEALRQGRQLEAIDASIKKVDTVARFQPDGGIA
ncbi:MAG: phage tail length tape measure family protein [Planctomycetia bacterium]|nr:phage tail length tape measure family protein [Planctomycetia bacterium]